MTINISSINRYVLTSSSDLSGFSFIVNNTLTENQLTLVNVCNRAFKKKQTLINLTQGINFKIIKQVPIPLSFQTTRSKQHKYSRLLSDVEEYSSIFLRVSERVQFSTRLAASRVVMRCDMVTAREFANLTINYFRQLQLLWMKKKGLRSLFT